MSAITDIRVHINQHVESILQFDPDKKEYDLEIPFDCFALNIKVDYDPAYYIRVAADKSAGRYMDPNLNPEMGDYIAGENVPYYDYYGGYLLRLDKRRETLKNDLNVHIIVEAGSYERGTESYSINLKRGSRTEYWDIFKKDCYHDEEFDIDMPYLLYVPKKYNPKKKYPLMVALHGTGERDEPIECNLEKMAMATAWAKDSEAGKNECIVLVPKCEKKYDDEDNWTSLVQFVNGHSNSPFWPMPQLHMVKRVIDLLKKEYSIDEKRMYLTGISSGGFGTYSLALEYPGTFAAIIPVSAASNPERAAELKGLPMWIFHSDDDPLVVPSWTLDPSLAALDAAGVEYKLTRYPAGQIFWQNAHFVWEVCYHDKEMRDWVFKQHL